VEYIRAGRKARRTIVLDDPHPVDSVATMWTSAARAALIGIFLLLFGAFLYFGRALLLPILAAAVIALTLAPSVRIAKRHGVSPWLTAMFVVLVALGVVGLVAMAIAGPVAQWIARAPEIGATVKERLSVLDRPFAALHQLENTLFGHDGTATNATPPDVVLPVVAFVTPAAGELLLFFGALLFFLVGEQELRVRLVSAFEDRDAKLRFLKIVNDIEKNLAGYLALVTVINAALGTVVAIAAFLLGFPNPVIFGFLAALLNYVPYVGPAVMVTVLFGVGLVTFPSLGYALVAPIGMIALTTAEGHFITPTIVGRRLTLNPLLVFLALAFWAWMWGPIGAFLAVPLPIVGLVVLHHVFPGDEIKLPE
jgi:predicted PurR-regulated permease PerM